MDLARMHRDQQVIAMDVHRLLKVGILKYRQLQQLSQLIVLVTMIQSYSSSELWCQTSLFSTKKTVNIRYTFLFLLLTTVIKEKTDQTLEQISM